MKTPPWLMAGALLFWGWQTGLWLWALPLAAALEGARWTAARWELSDLDLNRFADLCWVLFLGAALLLYSMADRLQFVFKLTQWMPFCFFPIMLAQAYGNREKMPLSVFWWLLRRSPHSPASRRSYNISFCYFACCLMATSASMRANSFFYLGMTVLVALALSSIRPKRITLAAWITLLLLVATAGQFGQRELHQAQNAIEIVLGSWIADLFGPPQDARELQTKIGGGPIPQSSRIVLRLHADPGNFVPPLLRERAWDAYRKEAWSATNNEFTSANPGASDTIKLLPTNNLASEIDVARYYENGEGMLALPHGTFELTEVPAEVRTNRLGEAKVEGAPGLMIFKAMFAPGKTIDTPPGPRDLAVDHQEQPALDTVLAGMKLDGMLDRQKIRAIERYFGTGYYYTLNPPHNRERMNSPTPLGFFLLVSHKGHCEYFGTATVLLLREAGIPARYITGYAVPDSARHGDTYLIRERDAHAWALAYHSDTHVWEQIDTTPGDWDKARGAQPPWWEPASDALSDLYYQFSKWRWSKTSYARFSTWLLVPLVLYLIARIAFNQRRKQPAGEGVGGPAPWPGLDSELYWINERLAPVQLSRLPNEPLLSWQMRLESTAPDPGRLRRIFQLHRGLRFDPRGLKPDERETLRREAQQWMAEFTARLEAQKAAAPGPP